VATSTQRETAIPQLAAVALLDRFDAIATGDEVANGKPSPDLFLLAAQRLNVGANNCLVLEDAEPGVIAARRAGMRVYLVPDLCPPSLEAQRAARGVFHSLVDVARHLKADTDWLQAR
jgi:beta-phosphoglucomutase-like phosphatase (HAD superfamily)